MKDSWKNKSVFEQQLDLNIKELNGRHPPHWYRFINFIYASFYNKISLTSILDVGCGAGVYCPLIKKYFSSVEYKGCDYSEEAIALAGETWGAENFFVLDFWDLSEEIVNEYDTILISAVLDVLEDGDKALEFLLQLKPKSVCVQRMAFTDKESFSNTYEAYGIPVYKFYHNREKFNNMLQQYNYKCFQFGDDKDSESYYLAKETV